MQCIWKSVIFTIEISDTIYKEIKTHVFENLYIYKLNG